MSKAKAIIQRTKRIGGGTNADTNHIIAAIKKAFE
jgi:hypothetical protein